MGVSDRLFGVSDLPYSMAGIRIFAEEERKNDERDVLFRDLTLQDSEFLPCQVAISTTPRPFFSL